MAFKAAVFASFLAITYAQTYSSSYFPTQNPFALLKLGNTADHYRPHYNIAEEDNGPDEYQFKYNVNALEYGDVKSQQEKKENGALRGSYSLIQPDGLRRIVEYVDDGSGFVANVRYEETGYKFQPQHSQPQYTQYVQPQYVKPQYTQYVQPQYFKPQYAQDSGFGTIASTTVPQYSLGYIKK